MTWIRVQTSADTWADWRGYVNGLVRIGVRIGADTWADRCGFVGKLVSICGNGGNGTNGRIWCAGGWGSEDE